MPFFSPEIYKDIFLPIYKRLSKPAQENGVPVVFHNCGKEELFLDFMVELYGKYARLYENGGNQQEESVE